MGAPGFWDDSERAGKVSAEHARVARRLEMFRALERDVEDLEGLAELAEEDESLEGEVEEHIASAEAGWRRSRSSACSPAPTTPATRW